MAIDLRELVAPEHTAVLTMECQRGVVGDLATMTQLRDIVMAKGSLDAAGVLCRRARHAGAQVVHCTAEFRSDLRGSTANCRLLAASKKMAEAGDGLTSGTPSVEVVPELDQQPSDIVIPRYHGLTPFTATSLDQILRNLGVTTIIAVGQSVNVGLTGLVLSGVDLGYQVVVPTDAVAGIPADYADAAIQHCVGYLATLSTTEDIVGAWDG